MSEPFTETLSDLGRLLGIDGLSPDIDGICQLVFDNKHTIQLVYLPSHKLILLSCEISNIRIAGDTACAMAKANFMQAGRGMILCMSPDDRPCMQTALKIDETNALELCELIELLLDQVESWHTSLQNENKDKPHGLDPSVLFRSV